VLNPRLCEVVAINEWLELDAAGHHSVHQALPLSAHLSAVSTVYCDGQPGVGEYALKDLTNVGPQQPIQPAANARH